jgi:hypothetical protein
MRRGARLRFILLIVIAGLLISFQLLTAPNTSGDEHQSVAPSGGADVNWHATMDELRQVQERLEELGFDPGPADGYMGQRTKAALHAYQRSIAAIADGRLTFDLYQRLTAEPEVGSPSQQQSLGAAAVESNCVPIIEGSWQFEDELGSKFTLTLHQDGSVADTPYPRHWRWKAAAGVVEITYDNGMGTSVTRFGRLADGVMLGDAKDSHGRAWVWKAVRVPLQPASDQGTCEAP